MDLRPLCKLSDIFLGLSCTLRFEWAVDDRDGWSAEPMAAEAWYLVLVQGPKEDALIDAEWLLLGNDLTVVQDLGHG